MLDSDSFGALYAEALVVQPKVGTFTKSYPNLKNMTLKVLGRATATVTYPGGVPLVAIDTSWLTVPTTFYFFVV